MADGTDPAVERPNMSAPFRRTGELHRGPDRVGHLEQERDLEVSVSCTPCASERTCTIRSNGSQSCMAREAMKRHGGADGFIRMKPRLNETDTSRNEVIQAGDGKKRETLTWMSITKINAENWVMSTVSKAMSPGQSHISSGMTVLKRR